MSGTISPRLPYGVLRNRMLRTGAEQTQLAR
ncbi:hypothetical protein FHR33_000298 [Nonomuraea dietziae]|uniref:Uncharacterized protein n=1 Tax=Nonomuraea dietziae TaxID=65515 RepID=A0A7W5V0Q6_9ACTN|nr:hypothetical protein [Nonomuraea dietziae]